MVAIKAHFDGKAFIPDEPVDLPRNQPVVLHVQHIAPAGGPSAASTSAESASLWEVLEKYSGTVDAPSDWSAEHDHYLYGTPKRNPFPRPENGK